MRKQMKQNKAITLITLVITIILLIILAGIAINISIGNNGLFDRAKQAKIENKKSQIIEYLDLKLLEEKAMDINANEKSIIEKTRENVIRNKEQLNKLGKEVEIKEVEEENEEVFFYVIVDKEIYKVSLEGTKYIGKQSNKDIELQTGDIVFTYTPSTETKGNVKVEIKVSKNIEGYKIEYKTEKTGQTGEVTEWINYTGEIELTRNQDVYARLSGIVGNTTVATGTVKNIDKLEPNAFTPTAPTITTNSIKIKAETTDQVATSDNICSGEIKYLFSKDGGKTWEPEEYQESGEYEFTGLTQNTPYTIKVKAKDKVGNEIEGTAIEVTTEKPLVTGIELNKTSTTLITGETETLTATVTPSNANNKSITWSSSDDTIATVDSSTGEITAVAEGTVTITATAQDGSGKSGSCSVIIENNVISFTQSALLSGRLECDLCVRRGD